VESVKPVVEGYERFEVTYAENQAEYTPLTTLRLETGLMSRWRLTDVERQYIADGGDIFILQLHFGGPLQPILPVAEKPADAMRTLVELTTPL
jgi:hypothetical protein